MLRHTEHSNSFSNLSIKLEDDAMFIEGGRILTCDIFFARLFGKCSGDNGNLPSQVVKSSEISSIKFRYMPKRSESEGNEQAAREI